MDDFINTIGVIAVVISGIVFIRMQSFLCIAHPQEWFNGIVAEIAFFAVSFVLYRNNKH